MAPGALLLLLVILLLHSLADSHGCHWTETCQSKWFGECTAGHIITDKSDDCYGLCGDSPPCLPFHTHFHCCKPDIPKVTNRCARCTKKMDFGDELICCSDCSSPDILDKSTKLGYCKSGAELSVQLKPQETFRWISGPWMKCSAPCDGGVRYRDVGCFGSTEDMSVEHYPVDDSMCSAEEMPARQELCNLKSCVDFSNNDVADNKQRGMPGWLVALFVLVGFVATGGLGFAGYTFLKRRRSSPSGYVYIMMEGYY